MLSYDVKDSILFQHLFAQKYDGFCLIVHYIDIILKPRYCEVFIINRSHTCLSKIKITPERFQKYDVYTTIKLRILNDMSSNDLEEMPSNVVKVNFNLKKLLFILTGEDGGEYTLKAELGSTADSNWFNITLSGREFKKWIGGIQYLTEHEYVNIIDRVQDNIRELALFDEELDGLCTFEQVASVNYTEYVRVNKLYLNYALNTLMNYEKIYSIKMDSPLIFNTFLDGILIYICIAPRIIEKNILE